MLNATHTIRQKTSYIIVLCIYHASRVNKACVMPGSRLTKYGQCHYLRLG
jgi:hypothetical protein